jgi:hypothetical protein
MGGGLLQLVAYGAQDVYLTGNPQITFFKVVYRRHTNFAMESIMQTFNGTAQYGNTAYATISRNGDLVSRAYLECTLPTSGSGNSYVEYVGLKLLKAVTIEIGGQQIDKHYSDWLYIWNELSLPAGKKWGWNKMVGADIGSNTGAKLYIPLEFWFCRNVGLALPLIALQYHEVKFKIEFETKANCVAGATRGTAAADLGLVGDLTDVNLWVDYIYLDTDERRKFAQLSHEYLIEQLQFTGSEEFKPRLKLNFNHPCKELIWVGKNNNTETNLIGKWTQYSNATGGNPFTNGLLQLNGNDRFAVRDATYFNLVQPYQHHTNIPSNKGINVYSFALKPEEHQPSGTLNMSRIDTAVLSCASTTAKKTNMEFINVYAVNYNVLRILSGMGGLAYSN